MRAIFFTGVLVLYVTIVNAQIDYKGLSEWSWHKQDSTEYYLYTPSNMNSDSVYPVALALHGCCGESYHATLRNTVDPLVRMWHNFGENTQQVPTYIIAPATSRGWSQHIPNLKKVIDGLVTHHRGDARRIYITGFSMGGDGTWEFLQQYPDYFAAAIPAGMNFHGDHAKIKEIPVWANRGETDYWADKLHSDIATIRKLNGDTRDSASSEETGINPRFSSFRGYGHGVQWVAASTQPLTSWAYSKINDGNKYPNVWFKSPGHGHLATNGSKLYIEINATDPDGSIQSVEVALNGQFRFTLAQAPYRATIIAPPGDIVLTATAIDDKGKTSTATTLVKSNIILPPGAIKHTNPGKQIEITEVKTENGITLPVGIFTAGSITHFDGDGEVTVNKTAAFDGMQYIAGVNADTTRGEGAYLSLTTQENTRVFIAYEKKDNLYNSTIPAWLSQWRKLPGKQIVAQYYYYHIYYRDFPKGKIELPRPDRLSHQVNNNYFVLISRPDKWTQ